MARGRTCSLRVPAAGATWSDALVAADPVVGKLPATVELRQPPALEVGPDGALLVFGAGPTLFEVDPATGAGRACGPTVIATVGGLDRLPRPPRGG